MWVDGYEEMYSVNLGVSIWINYCMLGDICICYVCNEGKFLTIQSLRCDLYFVWVYGKWIGGIICDR